MATIDTDKTWPDGADERFAAAPVAERGRGGTCRRFRRLGHGETAPMTAQNQPENDRDLPSADLRSVVQPLSQKYFCFSESTNQSIFAASRATKRGASRSSRTRRGLRWPPNAPETRAAGSGRPSRVVLTPRRRRQVSGGTLPPATVTSTPDSPGRSRSKP